MAYTSQPANQVIGGLTITLTRPSGNGGTGAGVDSGALLDGCKIGLTQTTYSPDIEQELNATKFIYTGKAYKLSYTYGEPTLRNMQNAWDINVAPSGAGPTVMSFGAALAIDFIPAALVVAVTGYSPGAATASSLRTINFAKCFVDTPGEMTITKKAITTVPVTLNCAYDAATSKVGSFSDVIA